MPRVMCVGHAVQDLVFTVKTMPYRAEKHQAEGFRSVGGGPAATAAVVVSTLGGDAHLAARVGDDEVARLIVSELQGYGVDCAAVRAMAGCRSSVSTVTVDETGERLIINYLDPGMPANPQWLPGPEGFDAVLADTRWPAGAQKALSEAKVQGIPAVLDADRPVPADGALLAAATHIAFSRDGLEDYLPELHVNAALRQVAEQTGAWCCVTLGGEGLRWIHGDESGSEPAFAVNVVDTLGAGDVWHGAFALALAEGSSEPDACRFANAAAAVKVQRAGGRDGVPSRDEVNTLMQRVG